METPDYDALIIGSGLGGLTTAALLASRGLRVAVLEKNQRLGGYAVSYQARGHRFDVATQALGGCGAGGIIQGILHELNLVDRLSFLPCEPARVYHFPDDTSPFIQHGFLEDQRLALSTSYPQYSESIDNCFSVFEKVFSELQNIAKSSENPMFGFTKNYPMLAKYGRYTVKEFFDSLDFPPELQLRLGARSGYCMLPLSKLSLVAFACTEMSYAGGAWMVEGGVSRLVDLLVDFIQKHNGHIVKQCRVEQLTCEEHRISGVVTKDGQRFTAQNTILAAYGQALLERSSLASLMLRKKYTAMIRSGSYHVSYYQVPAHLLEGMAANIEVRLAEQTLAGKIEIDVYYLLIPSLIDGDSAPAGFHSFCISIPLDHGVLPDRQQRQEMRKTVESLVQQKFPHVAGHLTFLFELGPEHFEAMTGNHNGSAYGWAQLVEQSGIYRLANNPRIDGLYLAGHWTMPGGGIAGVMTSGKLCAGAILSA